MWVKKTILTLMLAFATMTVQASDWLCSRL